MFSVIAMERLSFLQKEQVNLALEHGLGRRMTARFARPCYNFLQMEQIRLFLEKEPDPKKARLILKPRMSWQMMKSLREKQESGEKRKISVLFLTVPAVLILLSGIFLLQERSDLVLTESECTLKRGVPFDAMKYVASWTNPKGRLILPVLCDTDEPGTHLAVYRLISGGREVIRTLRVKVE